jgi:hypothetical protein
MDRFFGYIEGYYGKMLSWDERRSLCAAMGALSLNTYVYAPKEDPYHRIDWKLPYPSSWTGAFRRFVTDASHRNVRVVPCLAPGLSFNYTSAAHYALLLKKMSVFARIGCRTIGLLMDDIPLTLLKNCRGSFSSLGEAHGTLLSRLQADLRTRFPRLSVWFCPTVYTDQCAPGGILHSSYLADLSVTIPPDVLVLWTGPAVIAGKLDKASLSPVSRLFHGNILVWDNLYANDYCPHRLFLGPYAGRNKDLTAVTRGVLLNPTGMPHTDAFLLSLLSAFRRNVPQVRARRDAAAKLPFAKDFSRVARFFGLPFDRANAVAMSEPAFNRCRAALHRLVWQWKSPLQREWYPYLYMLDTDLRLLKTSGDSAANRRWIRKKYPAVLSAILVRRASAGKRVRS